MSNTNSPQYSNQTKYTEKSGRYSFAFLMGLAFIAGTIKLYNHSCNQDPEYAESPEAQSEALFALGMVFTSGIVIATAVTGVNTSPSYYLGKLNSFWTRPALAEASMSAPEPQDNGIKQ